MRRPVDSGALAELEGARIEAVDRRAKYLVFRTDRDRVILLHLGMSGRVLIGTALGEPGRHDHVSWWLEGPGRNPLEVRLQDPRRFGLVLVVREANLPGHPLIAHLGPEPLTKDFTVEVLCVAGRRSRRPVKNMLMDARVVVGVGNIYAAEALWRARVHPGTPARRIALARWRRVHSAIVEVLTEAISAGGTTLRDYRDADGNLGYFGMSLAVYSREGQPCPRCGRAVRRRVDSGRSTFYCPGCQH
jgi:formamidopyrimidine-DNA glycosylase